MRLIDADALRIDFKNRVKACDKWIEECAGEEIKQARAIATKDFLFEVIMTIDQAPTIKSFTLADIEEQYRKGLEKGLEEARLHGEWKHDQFGDFFKSVSCSNCGLQSAFEFPFCPSCGTKMHKGGEVK